jgi:hypothetical protein
MAKPKIEISNAALLKRMKRYEEVTGKEIASSLRRGGRLLAVSLAKATPPFGFSVKDKDPTQDDPGTSSLHKGEKAVFRDIFRVFYVMTQGRIRGIIDFQGREAKFQYGHKGAAPLGEIKEKILTRGEMKGWHQQRRGKNGRVGMVHLGKTTGHRIRDLIHLDKGIVPKLYIDAYYKERMRLVGLSKAAWASCIMKMDLSKSDIKNIWSGIPAWVKRHVSRVPSGVTDKCDLMFPEIKLTNRLPWANSVMSYNDYREALRITREKFMKSMNKEIKAVLKKAASA